MKSFFTVEGLRSRLERAGVNADLYEIGGYSDDRYCIEPGATGSLETYLGERGQKTGLRVWEDEADACFWFLGRLAWTEWG